MTLFQISTEDDTLSFAKKGMTVKQALKRLESSPLGEKFWITQAVAPTFPVAEAAGTTTNTNLLSQEPPYEMEAMKGGHKNRECH